MRVFLTQVLNINDSEECIRIDRAHRVGAYRGNKVRPIVVKFQDTASKMRVKDALKLVRLRDTPYNVTDQYPQEVQQRCKDLIPHMVQARREGKKAVLVRDKLYINNKLFSLFQMLTLTNRNRMKSVCFLLLPGMLKVYLRVLTMKTL